MFYVEAVGVDRVYLWDTEGARDLEIDVNAMANGASPHDVVNHLHWGRPNDRELIATMGEKPVFHSLEDVAYRARDAYRAVHPQNANFPNTGARLVEMYRLVQK